ncbi:MAG: L-serine ammonia-lyase, iron-sulfur-dependent, subunit alpha [Clostridiaceae bacterium]|nr:L-serine ammonia-lyase, iron-sulfur-dependent, subunit alpha [Clostridiaceae bacterium]
MDRHSPVYNEYVNILKEELIPAMGCTEPIAVAYAAASCRDLLACPVERCRLVVSGPIIKNVKSVVVPNTEGLKGLDAAVAAGIVGGNADALLEVVASIRPEQHEQIRQFIREIPVEIVPSDNGIPFYIDLTLFGSGHSARVVMATHHTNVVRTERDGEVLFEKPSENGNPFGTDHSVLSVEHIWDFVNTMDLADTGEVLRRQVEYNTAVARAGLNEDWGAEIGKTLLATGDDLRTRARAAAAAGSDARMSGCELPVVIVSGSGNQGMTASLPVIEYARALGSPEDKLLRALALSDLLAIHQKGGIGRISAFCGAVCAGVGAACGIAYLEGCDLDTVCHVIVNALAITSGMVCDGAKPSCAAKIAASVDAGLLGYSMYKNGHQFYAGDGIVKKDVEKTIAAVGEMASRGMRETDRTILDIMVRPD